MQHTAHVQALASQPRCVPARLCRVVPARVSVAVRHSTNGQAADLWQPASSCSSLQPVAGASTSSGSCQKTGGSCSGGCSGGSGNGNSTLAMALGMGATGAPAGVGGMGALMSQVSISRSDIESVMALPGGQGQASQGQRVLSIADILAQCPDDLVFEDDDDGQVL